MKTALPMWPETDYCVAAVDSVHKDLAAVVYERVCRTDFSAPGFCLLNLGQATSQELRDRMIDMKSAMQQIHRSRAGKDLVLLSAGRFDQQISTKPHRDGAPDESFLMLGYEPSTVCSEVIISDYSKCAFEMGITPAEFLERHNPMFAVAASLLDRYSTSVSCFSNEDAQILLINNSMASYSETGSNWQGVLHTAQVFNPDERARRVVNSCMIASVLAGDAEPISAMEQEDFVTTKLVRRRGYDKVNLADDE